MGIMNSKERELIREMIKSADYSSALSEIRHLILDYPGFDTGSSKDHFLRKEGRV